jgi:hypothetical protein
MGVCHRNEPHGALHGILRVRQFTQDDAHIFCREDQLVEEVRLFLDLLDTVYKDLGFPDYQIKLALRPEKRFGSEEMWDWSEQSLRDAVKAAGRDTAEFGWEELPGEGAFYAPKLEFHLTDAIGRTWQVGTIQTDTVLPERLDASYVAEDGQRHRPVMLHRAILGSFERFIGILIEHHAGKLPMWLAPVQAVVATIVSDANDYAEQVAAELRRAGLRVETDFRNEKINYKVREHSLAKVPNLLVIGKREAEEGTVALRPLAWTRGRKCSRSMPSSSACARKQRRRTCATKGALLDRSRGLERHSGRAARAGQLRSRRQKDALASLGGMKRSHFHAAGRIERCLRGFGGSVRTTCDRIACSMRIGLVGMGLKHLVASLAAALLAQSAAAQVKDTLLRHDLTVTLDPPAGRWRFVT